MAIAFEQLQALLKGEKLSYYIAPDRPVVRFGIRAMFGNFEIILNLQDEGRFLQFRTVGYLTCTANHPNISAVLLAVARVNCQMRLVKFGWDASDGEITAFADVWLMDNTLTQQQFNRMLNNFVPAIDTVFPRLKAAMDTGNDPGDKDPQTLVAQIAKGQPSVPPELKDLLDKLGKKDGDKPEGDKSEGPKPEIKEI